MIKKKWVVKDCYGYWEHCGTYKRTTGLKDCTKFRFWISAFLVFFDEIILGAKVVKL